MSFALLCPGQGAQRAGLLDAMLAEPALETLEEILGMPRAEIAALPTERLLENRIAQPVIAAYQLAQWAHLAPLLPTPRLAAGYSLGELIALGCAGSFGLQQTLRLAARRAALMDAACPEPCAMLAVRGLAREAASALARDHGVFVAIRNGEDRFVLGGVRAAMPALEAAASAKGASCTPIGVGIASHTPLLAGAAQAFYEALDRPPPDAPAFAVLSTLDGMAMRRPEVIRQRLSAQISTPLDWAACLDALAEQGVTVCLELGPGTDLSRMLRERHPQIAGRGVEEFSTLDAAAHWVSARL